MSSINELEKQVQMYHDLAKEDKNIDVAALMLNALENQKRNLISTKQKKWAYWISIGLPPLGLLFALKFYFNDKNDGKRTAVVCLILTAISIVVAWISLATIFSGSGTNVEQIKQINPDDIRQLYQ
jgi:hypothetical protein